ncbi:hypothetical protein IFE17_11155 [Actinobacillus sp. GY-402]|nr:hypothetical protein IFE17_11155 [Actinobacillus sp. GY-402]
MINDSSGFKKIDFYGTITDKIHAQLLMLESVYRLTLCLSIGLPNETEADYFYVDVFNTNYVKENKFVMGSKSFVIDDFDDIENEIKIFVNSICGEDWEEILVKLRRYFDWEYENHKFIP